MLPRRIAGTPAQRDEQAPWRRLFLDWIVVKGLKISCYNEELLFSICPYLVTEFKFLNSNPVEGEGLESSSAGSPWGLSIGRCL